MGHQASLLTIKKIKNQDLYLKLIVENLYSQVFESDVAFTLDDFYMTQEERIKKEQEARKQSEREPGDKSDNMDIYIWTKRVSYTKEQLHEPDIMIKKIGRYKAYLSHEKVQTLFSYDRDRKWSKRELEEELEVGPDSYEVIRREEILKNIQSLEKVIYNSYKKDPSADINDLKAGGNQNFKMYVVNGVLVKKNLTSQDDADWLIGIDYRRLINFSLEDLEQKSIWVQKAFALILLRNKFAHNQLPAERFLNYIENEGFAGDRIEKTYSRYLAKVANTLILDLKKVLNPVIEKDSQS